MKSGFVMDSPRSERPRGGQSEENVGTVREACHLSQGNSIQRKLSELNISTTSIQRILKRVELRLFLCKIPIFQELERQDYNSRWKFVKLY